MEMATNNHRPSHKFSRVGLDDCHRRICDPHTKIVQFVPCGKEIAAQQYARVFIDHVFKLHGLPEVIISDFDPGS